MIAGWLKKFKIYHKKKITCELVKKNGVKSALILNPFKKIPDWNVPHNFKFPRFVRKVKTNEASNIKLLCVIQLDKKRHLLWIPNKTSSKRISTSKCDICILKLILTLFVQQNYWQFWMRVGSISFVLQNSWHFQMMEEYDRIYLFVFCLSFGNSLGIFNLQSRQFA